MKCFDGKYRGRQLSYAIYEHDYEFMIDCILYNSDYTVTSLEGVDMETACKMHIDMICDDLDEQERPVEENNKLPTQDEILAEVLLGQAEIISNQVAQDEVLAEMLLNSLEV